MAIERLNTAWYGWKTNALDARDHFAALLTPSGVNDPIDLRKWCPPIMNQDQLGSCVWHAVTAAARWQIKRHQELDPGHGIYDFDMSRLQGYYDTRFMENSENSDSGCEIRNALKVLSKYGVGHEKLWPYDIKKFEEKPPQAVYDDAVQYKAQGYERVLVNGVSIRTALHHLRPVIIGISVYESFEQDVGSDGIVPMPRPGQGEKMVGGHAMLNVGWSVVKPGYYTLQNSYDTDWGDHGFGHFPGAYIDNPAYGSDYTILKLFGSDAEQAAKTAA